MSKKVRVLVVDDSALMRKLIPQILERDQAIEVVGTAMDGGFGLRKLEELKPDVITVDLDMPRVDGMEMLRQIAPKSNVPVIVFSAHSTAGASATFKALALGAFDFVAKPRSPIAGDLDMIAADLVAKVKAAAQAGPRKREPALPEIERRPKKAACTQQRAKKVVAIGISTGGPNALQYLLSQLPANFPAAIVVVQHMPEGFTELFARRLNDTCAVEVKEASSGDMLYAGRVLIAPGNRHMQVRRRPLGDVVVLNDDPKCNGHRPSADFLFRSVAQEFGSDSLGLIMTGMGEDGADALGTIKTAGGLTVAQDESSCVVFGMPKAAIERGTAMRVVSLDALANTLIVWSGSEQSSPMAKASVALV